MFYSYSNACPFVCLSVSICVCVYGCASVSMCLSVCVCVTVCVCLSRCLSVCLSVRTYVCTSVYVDCPLCCRSVIVFTHFTLRVPTHSTRWPRPTRLSPSQKVSPLSKEPLFPCRISQRTVPSLPSKFSSVPLHAVQKVLANEI